MSEFLLTLGQNAAVSAFIFALGLAAARLRVPVVLVRAIWLLALAKLLAPAFWFHHVPMPGAEPAPLMMLERPPAALPFAGEAAPGAPEAAPKPGFPLPPSEVWVGLWILGAALCLIQGLLRARRCHAIVGRSRLADGAIQDQARSLAHRMGLRRTPEVRLVAAPLSPFLWVLGRKAFVVLPEKLPGAVDSNALESVLAHECAHYARGDHRVRWVELVALAAHWWNPLSRVLCRRLHELEEIRCDARAAVALGGDRKRYGRALLQVTDFLSSIRTVSPAMATGFGGAMTLKRRIEMLVCSEPRSLRGRVFGGALLVAVAAVLPMGLRAQERSKPRVFRVTIEEVAPESGSAVNQGFRFLSRGTQGEDNAAPDLGHIFYFDENDTSEGAKQIQERIKAFQRRAGTKDVRGRWVGGAEGDGHLLLRGLESELKGRESPEGRDSKTAGSDFLIYGMPGHDSPKGGDPQFVVLQGEDGGFVSVEGGEIVVQPHGRPKGSEAKGNSGHDIFVIDRSQRAPKPDGENPPSRWVTELPEGAYALGWSEEPPTSSGNLPKDIQGLRWVTEAPKGEYRLKFHGATPEKNPPSPDGLMLVRPRSEDGAPSRRAPEGSEDARIRDLQKQLRELERRLAKLQREG